MLYARGGEPTPKKEEGEKEWNAALQKADY